MSREYINATQATLLAALADAPGSNRRELAALTQLSLHAVRYAVPDMLDRGLIDAARTEKNGHHQLTLTALGAQAMAERGRVVQTPDVYDFSVARAPSVSLYSRPVWQPTPQVPARNNGHRHIASVGVRC